VIVQGTVVADTNPPSSSLIFNLQPGYRPLQGLIFGATVAAAGGTLTSGQLNVVSSGNVQTGGAFGAGAAPNAWLSLAGVQFFAEW
jgi:hypothetical protein